MKKTLLISFIVLCVAACTVAGPVDPYADSLCKVEVAVVFPEGYDDLVHEGIAVNAEEISLGHRYSILSDAEGVAGLTLPKGMYRFSISDIQGENIFNGTLDKVAVKADASYPVKLVRSKKGSIVIKEIYCGGCKMLPLQGDFQYDKYVMLHNNSMEVQYLDSLCIGATFPFNSNATNPFVSVDPATGLTEYADFVPIPTAILRIGGDGSSFPLEPGADAVICINGAVDHTAQYPLSVNLNKPYYFVLYSETDFPNTVNHPAPGSNIQEDHHLVVVKKLSKATAFVLSMNSPAVVIYRAKGKSIEEFALQPDMLIDVPGMSSVGQVLRLPMDWVMDAVEVFNGTEDNNKKRFTDALDAGYVTLSETGLGHTLMRKVDEELSANMGFEYLTDTNNSSQDFYESEVQSLHE